MQSTHGLGLVSSWSRLIHLSRTKKFTVTTTNMPPQTTFLPSPGALNHNPTSIILFLSFSLREKENAEATKRGEPGILFDPISSLQFDHDATVKIYSGGSTSASPRLGQASALGPCHDFTFSPFKATLPYSLSTFSLSSLFFTI
jgi:hypothetical protein